MSLLCKRLRLHIADRHDVQAMALTDPVTGHPALLLLQTDITSRAELEARMSILTECQLSMLEQMFPRYAYTSRTVLLQAKQGRWGYACLP